MKAMGLSLILFGVFQQFVFSSEESLFEGRLKIVNNCKECPAAISSNARSYFSAIYQEAIGSPSLAGSAPSQRQVIVLIDSLTSFSLKLYTNQTIVSKIVMSNQATVYSCDYWDNGRIKHEDKALGNGKTLALNYNRDGYPLSSLTLNEKTQQFDGECRYYKESGSMLHKMYSGEIKTSLDYIEHYSGGLLQKKVWYEPDGKTVKNEISY